ncbi:PAS domain S-box protein [Sphingobium sp. Ant17]|uniref:PAS domain S-box protein n=1 Tax=Sphingobium sp. Ant17 TaxID=1461752 RepID=UPI0004B56681|nr:PAS domain S-box protein [Sphingobium sp. Ant17]
MKRTPEVTTERLGRIVEEASSEVYLFATDDFHFLLVNRGARDNLGFSMEELRGRTPWDIKPEICREDFLKLVEPLISGATERLDFETVHQRKDGTRYDVSIRLQLIQPDGEGVYYAAVQDLSELRHTQAALQESNRRLDAILSNTTMAVFMMDERQHCVFMNNAAEELTGFTLAETHGKTLHEVVHHTYPDGRHFPIEECAIDRAFPEENQTAGEEIFVHKDGSFYPVGFTASAMRDESGIMIGTIIEARNISEDLKVRAAMEAFNSTLVERVEEAIRERKKLERQLVQSQKMEAVGQLTGGVAHDFNNLLQVIGGNLQLLEKDIAGNERQLRRVHNALAGVRRGAELASQLLAFGRQQALNPKPVNIGRLVRGMDDMLRRTLSETVEIETIISGGLWNCLVDPTQVENVILNLAINARDAMDRNGKLTIEVGNASLDEAYAAQHAEVVPGQYVMLAVTDTGSGIPHHILKKVFEPFFTTKDPGQGTGLGLSMVYGFVKQSNGHINIYSEVGEGTTVRIYLPHTRQNEEILASETPTAPQSMANEVILVVEDDDTVRATSVELLSDLGYTILEASNADNGLAIVNSGAKIDLLFTDVVMPGALKSQELARRAKQKLPSIQVLFYLWLHPECHRSRRSAGRRRRTDREAFSREKGLAQKNSQMSWTLEDLLHLHRCLLHR